VENKLESGIGRPEFATIKLNRFIAPTGDELPDGISGVADDAQVAVAAAPAISDSGVLATRMIFKAGKKASQALLVEGSGAGGTLLPAVRGQPAPVGPGDDEANWASFSDPVIAPNGTYAFVGKVSGSAKTANGVWTNMSGTLQLALRQGSPVPGLTEKLASVLSISMENNALIALVKLAAPGGTNIALVRLDSTNAGTVLLRTGQSGLMIDGTDYTVKSFTVLSPAPQEAGDGRWQGFAGVVARVSAVKTSDSKAKATAIVSINNAGTANAFMFTGQTAAAPDFRCDVLGLRTAFNRVWHFAFRCEGNAHAAPGIEQFRPDLLSRRYDLQRLRGKGSGYRSVGSAKRCDLSRFQRSDREH
jgi:hypothetical protein